VNVPVSPGQFVTAVYEPAICAEELPLLPYVPVVLNVHVMPFAKSTTIDPDTALDDVTVNTVCATIVALVSASVIVPPALAPCCANVALTEPLPPTESVIVPE